MKAPGFFITLEGGEGTGKSTQSGLLAEALRGRGYDVVVTREPGGTPEAEKIRELLVRRDGGRWSPVAETLLFFAARAMHVDALIKPALAEGKIVICDRFTDSTRAYQCYGHGLGGDMIEQVAFLSLGGFEPDMTFILDIEPEAGLRRSGKRLSGEDSSEDRFENLDVAFHERLREGYLEIAKENPERCIVIDARRSVGEIAGDIAAHVFSRMAIAETRRRGQAERV